jgi:hypothetical protein
MPELALRPGEAYHFSSDAGPSDDLLLEPSFDELRDVMEPEVRPIGRTDDHISPETIGSMMRRCPTLKKVVIANLQRRGESGNLVAPTKVKKTWLAYGLGLSIVTGRDWLDTFPCEQGKVLIIDNELHPETLAHRIPVVAEAMGIPRTHYENDLHVVSLRGRLMTLPQLHRIFDRVASGYYIEVIADALYRFLPPGVSENDNGAMANLFNLIDSYAAAADCGWLNIVHTSKGLQGEKAVVDVGAGAGSQARAVDSHIVLRPHEEDDTVVMEAAVRSFKPLAPLALRWAFPLWIPDGGVDPTLLKGRLTKGEQRTQDRDKEGKSLIVDALRTGPHTMRRLRAVTKLSQDRCQKLVDQLEADEQVTFKEINVRGNITHEYQLKDVVDE